MDDIDVLQAALELKARLDAGLADYSAQSIELSRDETILALGMTNALIELLQR